MLAVRALRPVCRAVDRWRRHRTSLLISLVVWTFAAPAAAQLSVTAPAGQTIVPAAVEFATREFQDPWDMNERTDLGWFLNGVDQPINGFADVSFADGVFSAISANNGPLLFLLETGIPGAAPLGRIGTLHPIDADSYRRLSFRMCNDGAPDGDVASSAQLFWSRETIYSDVSTPHAFLVFGGCHVYSMDLRAWSAGRMPNIDLDQDEWTGTMRVLRFDPTSAAGQTVTIDWVALTAVDDSASFRTITWSSGAAVDIYLDTNQSEGDGTLGLLVGETIPARNVSGGSYTFQIGALPPGDYYVAMRPSGSGAALTYSSGFYRVEAVPTLTFLSPHPEGSADDFATTFLGNSWDMDSLADLDRSMHFTGAVVTSIAAETPAGVSLGTPSVLAATSAAAPAGMVGDPLLYFLWSTERGRHHRIDTSRYRILTAELGIAGARDINGGSIARVVWKRSDEASENVSQDIIVNHRAGANVLSTFTVDMASLPLETDPGGSPSVSGWTGLVDNFRIDPHEFASPRAFQFRRVKLAALERANDTYTVRWALGGAARDDATVSLYYDFDGTGVDGVPIAIGLDPDNAGPGMGSHQWNISGLGDGTYHVYAEIAAGGQVINRTYARWPIVVDHAWQPLPNLVLDRQALYFAAIGNGATKTGAQEVTVSVAGSGAPAWTASSITPGCDFVTITSGSGVGGGRFRVAIDDRTTYPSGATFFCTIRLDAPGAGNAPQFLDVRFTVQSSSTAPFGVVDTPPDHATGIAGALPVTGWALDDLGVAEVALWRDPVSGESSPHANGKIYLGAANLVSGARPDVEAARPTLPMAYRGGWGYMLLTNMLPSQGNGTYRLHAYATDVEGHVARLGSRTITCANAGAVRPFGAIDTPGQGGTASGSAFVNFGWTLAYPPNIIPTDGSTIWVFIDGVPVGHPVYNNYRADIAALFPGFANSMGAVGYFVFDTTGMENGLHTIAWSVTDSGGNGEGIGSRYFTVSNTGGSAHLDPGHGPELGRVVGQLAGLTRIAAPLDVRLGYGRSEAVELFPAGAPLVAVPELGRLDVGVDGGGFSEAYLIASGRLAALPTGASLDRRTGRLLWQPGPGFVGDYRLALVRQTERGREVADVTVRVAPLGYAASRTTRRAGAPGPLTWLRLLPSDSVR